METFKNKLRKGWGGKKGWGGWKDGRIEKEESSKKNRKLTVFEINRAKTRRRLGE